jgi:hypothetical protein
VIVRLIIRGQELGVLVFEVMWQTVTRKQHTLNPNEEMFDP